MTDEPPIGPTLAAWLAGAVEAHPLHPLLAGPEPFVVQWLSTLNTLLRRLEELSPGRLESKKREFQQLRTEQGFLEWRAEIVVAVKIGNAGVTFDFGATSTANPDIVIPAWNLGVEVTGKTPEGVIHLYDELEKALQPTPDVSVHLVFSTYPVRINQGHREAIVHAVTVDAVKAQQTRGGNVFWHSVEDPKNVDNLSICVQVLPQPSLGAGYKVTWETSSGELTTPLGAVEHAVFAIGDEPAKRRQAESMPTLLAVDVTRLGAGWIRSPRVWAQMLRANMPTNFPFVALAVITPQLGSEDTEMGLALGPTTDDAERDAVHKLATRLGLTPVD